MNTDWPQNTGTGFQLRQPSGERFLGLAIAIALHVVAVWGLLQFDPVRRSLIEVAPIMVNFITPPQVTQPPKPTEPPRPQQIAKTSAPTEKPQEPAPLFTTKVIESPAQWIVPEPEKSQEVAPIAAAPAPPTAVTPPSFDAAYLRNPPPAYPPQSKRRHEEGKVLLRVYVNAAGVAEKIEIHTSSGWPRLDEAAQESVSAWHFIPAKQGDKAIAAWVIVPINFTDEG